MRRRHILFRLIAAVLAACLGIAVTACSSSDDTSDDGTQDAAANSRGTIAIFTPTDGLTISQHTPLNKWQSLVPELTDALTEQGYDSDNIVTQASSTLEDQSHDVQDYVVSTIGDTADDNNADASEITLIVAPVSDAEDSTRQYGDYVSSAISWEDDTDDSDTDDADPADSDSTAESTTDTSDDDTAATDSDDESDNLEDSDSDNADDDDDDETLRQAAERLVSTLNLAKESGMTVILLSNELEGFTPDVFVQMSDAASIGAIQAQKVVEKLNLDSTSTDNPKAIEVLLPYDSEDGSDTTFAQEAFAGMWEVLAPYFQEGTAVSPSGLLDADTTVDDWMNVAFDATDDQAIVDELTERLGMDDADTHTRIDGVVAMNDYVASAVIDCLTTLGYTGTSADINPSITIQGIVGNITGQVDLQKEAVPDPIKAPEESDSDDDDVDLDQINSQWPIVTGYGAYLDIMPQIVDGQQWMTALEDRLTLSADIAEVCAKLEDGESVDDLDYISQTEINSTQVTTISEPLLAVSASNLKDELIDPGYITLADAGL